MSTKPSQQPYVRTAQDDYGDRFAVWLEPDDYYVRLGLCIGAARTRRAALKNAQASLERALKQVRKLQGEEGA